MHIDREVVVEMVNKNLTEEQVGSELFERIVDVCFFAGYQQTDVSELCEAITNYGGEEFNRGMDVLK